MNSIRQQLDSMSKSSLNTWTLSLDLNKDTELVFLISGGREFQSQGTGRLKTLFPIVVKGAVGE